MGYSANEKDVAGGSNAPALVWKGLGRGSRHGDWARWWLHLAHNGLGWLHLAHIPCTVSRWTYPGNPGQVRYGLDQARNFGAHLRLKDRLTDLSRPLWIGLTHPGKHPIAECLRGLQ